MLIATSLATVLFAAVVSASAGADASPVATSVPPMAITLAIAPGVPASLVTKVLAETDAIWRAGGFSFVWQRAVPLTAASRLDQPEPYRPSTLRVVIGQDRGIARDHRTPLGWIVFDDERAPQQEIYLSYANAVALMESARAVVGVVSSMPIMQRELLLARAMGRALAHEMAHYLLASKVHTRKGVLQASRTAAELFSTDRRPFGIDAVQRQEIVARLRAEPRVASR